MSFTIRKLNKAETLGEKLKALRQAANFTLSDVSARTKIRKCYLLAFERGDFGRLPEPLYARNYLKTYTQFLGADANYFINLFDEERGTCDLVKASRLPRERVRAGSLFVPSRFVKIAALSLTVLSVIAYLGYQLRAVSAPPEIVIASPFDGLSTREATVLVSGLADREATVRVNGVKVLLDADGQFETDVALERGLNVITIEGAKRYSQPAKIYRRVVLEESRQTAAVDKSDVGSSL